MTSACLVLQVSNAIRNSLRVNPSGRPQDGPMGITLALSPVQREDLFSKHAITNASFRARRLPGQWPHNFPLSLFMWTVKLFLNTESINNQGKHYTPKLG